MRRFDVTLDVMYYGAAGSVGVFLTRDDLKHTVLLHVGGKVPSPHVLLHYADVGQLLMERRHGRVGSGNKLCFGEARCGALPPNVRS